MKKFRIKNKQRAIVWLVWLLVATITLLQPGIASEYDADTIVRDTGIVIAETPDYELFPWWSGVIRWRKGAGKAYRRWKRAQRRARRAAQLSRMMLAGTLTFATLVDLLTKWQLRRQLGAIPVLYAVLETLHVRTIINRYCANKREVDTGTVALVMILNRLMSPCALVHVADWAAKTILVNKLGIAAEKFNDDRLGRALDQIAPHCQDIWVDVVSVAIERYDIDLSIIFYDLTAFVVHGDYDESEYIAYGHAHNTPMGKQKFKIGLDVTADGNIPVSYFLWAGNTADKATVQHNLEKLCDTLRAHGYKTNQVLLIGDRANLDDKRALAYADKGIRYLAGLQPQKKIHRQILENVPENEFYQHPLTEEHGKDGYWGVSVQIPFEHLGQKVTHYGLVVLSGPMRSAFAQTNKKHFKALWPELLSVQWKAHQNKLRYRSAKAVKARAETKLRNSPVGKFVEISASGEKGSIKLHWKVKKNELQAVMRQKGRYLLVTNDPSLAPHRMLSLYRDKDGVEKRFTVCKGDLNVSPVYLHKDDRIKAMLLINMLALLTYSILERQMRKQGLQLTTRRLITQLETLDIIETHCWDGSVSTRATPATTEQQQLLSMMEAILQLPLSKIVGREYVKFPSFAPPLLLPS